MPSQPPKNGADRIPGIPPPKTKWLRDALNKVQGAIADPRVANTAKIGNAMLEVAARIGQAQLGGPLAVGGAVLGVVDVVRRQFDIHQESTIDLWFKQPEQASLISKSSWLPIFLSASGAMASLNLKSFIVEGGDEIRGVQDVAGKRFMFRSKAQEAEQGDTTTVKGFEFAKTVWYDEGFDMGILSNAIWATAHTSELKLVANPEGLASIVPMPVEEHPYLDFTMPVDRFIEKWNKYRERNISRALLLFGPGGTGKTRWVKALTKKIGGRMLMIPPDTLNGNARTEIELWTDLLRPDVILFDDIHRAKAGIGHALSVFDDIRGHHKKALIVSTCNRMMKNTREVFRPGRCGKRVKMESPTPEQKVKLLREYMQYYEVDVEAYDIEALVSLMQHEDFSHDYVRSVAEEAIAMDQGELMEYAEQVNAYIVELASGDSDDYDYDDADYDDESEFVAGVANMTPPDPNDPEA